MAVQVAFEGLEAPFNWCVYGAARLRIDAVGLGTVLAAQAHRCCWFVGGGTETCEASNAG